MIRRLHAILAEIAKRRQRQRLHGGLALVWWVGLLAALVLSRGGAPVRGLLLALAPPLGAASAGVWWWSRRGMGDPRNVPSQRLRPAAPAAPSSSRHRRDRLHSESA